MLTMAHSSQSLMIVNIENVEHFFFVMYDQLKSFYHSYFLYKNVFTEILKI